MQAIVAAGEGWGIGAGGALLARIPEDMALFREKTAGKAVVMGRGTLRSLPGARPLPGRANYVLSRDPAFAPPPAPTTVTVCRSLAGLARALARAGHAPEDVFVIGGQDVYALLLPYCGLAYVTRFSAPSAPAPDRFFPDLDALPGWALEAEGPRREHGGVAYSFRTYRNLAPLDILALRP
jgi:dihydrofolate reductase